MEERRTGAKRGGSPIWYVRADREVEREAMRIGLLEEQAPLYSSWKYVLAWGFGSRAEAQAEMEEMAEEVGEAVAAVKEGQQRMGDRDIGY